jgi:hypothetical protein
MNKVAKYTLVSLVVAAAGSAAVGANADWKEHRRHCDYTGKAGGQPMAMMQKGRPGQVADRNLDLSAEQAKTLVEAKLIMRGNDRLKVGQVAEKDKDTYVVDIVTVDDSLVRQVEVDRDNGLPRGPMGSRR